MATAYSTPSEETAVTSFGDNGERATCSKNLSASYTSNHLGVQDGYKYNILGNKASPASRSRTENGRQIGSGAKTHGSSQNNEEHHRKQSLICSICALKKRFHLFSIFRYIFIGSVFTMWLVVTVSICVVAFSYTFYLGLLSVIIVFLQISPVAVIGCATYGNCCSICDPPRPRYDFRAKQAARSRRAAEEERAMIATYTIVMPTVVVSQATSDSSRKSGEGTACV